MRNSVSLTLVVLLALVVGVASAGPPGELVQGGGYMVMMSCDGVSAASPAQACIDEKRLDLDTGIYAKEVVGIPPHRASGGQGRIHFCYYVAKTKGKAVLKISHAADFQHRHVST